MIQVDRLTKRYGSLRAVDRLSFTVGRGEIVGFLGPNGAGKTTSMRMLTTYLAPTSGRASLAGFDVLDAPLDVRRHVGYMPESVPLYTEMRVREFLDFRARLKDVPRSKRRAAIGFVLDRCRLREVEDRVIGHLSKGYRQRVGLAESMVHDPDILILDEPTAGLDPLQIREVRALIRELGDRHTILLSTHIMQEVEAVCGRVLMIVRGRIAIDERVDRLHEGRAIELEVRGPADSVRKAIETTAGVARAVVRSEQDGLVVLEVGPKGEADPREAIARRVIEGGWGLLRLERRRSTLEDRFVEAVRDAAVAAGSDATNVAESEAA